LTYFQVTKTNRTAAEFEKATAYVRNMPTTVSVPDATKLGFYAHFKQATAGPCAQNGGAQPYKVQFESRAKWDTWNALGAMNAEEAKTKYVELLDGVVKDWRSQ
jgi:diazepam-binding inhibitor (GABA receptor modulating acyl-CoA-binding protein)